MESNNNSADILPIPLCDRKTFKKSCSRKVGGGLIIYTIISFAVVIVASIVNDIYRKTNNLGEMNEKTDSIFSGSAMIAAVVLGLIILFACYKHFITPKQIIPTNKKMSVPDLLGASSLFVGLSIIYSFVMDGMEIIFNKIGYTIQDCIDTANLDMELSIPFILYAGIIGPIAEEMVYRGFVMKSLEKNGKVFAIITSSVLFGIMHGNPAQIPYCMVGGLIFGYVASKFGIIYSMFLHIVNNFVFGIILEGALDKYMSDKAAETTENILLGILLVIGIIFVIIRRDRILTYLKNNFTKNKCIYLWTFTTIPVIIFIVYGIGAAVSLVDKL